MDSGAGRGEVREQRHSSDSGWFWGLAPAHDTLGQGWIMIAANC